jgi:hypothetical protein
MPQAFLSTGVPNYSLLDYSAASASYASVAPTATKPTTGVIYDSPSSLPSLLRVLPFSSVNNATTVGMRVVGWTQGSIPKRYSNRVPYSQQFDNATWTKSAVTVSANTETAPDGTATADVLLETTANSGHNAYWNTGDAGWATGTYTFSAYLKAGKGRDFATVTLGSSPSNRYYRVCFNLLTGEVTQTDTQTGGGSVGSVGSTVTNAGNGWWRVSIYGDAMQFYLIAPSRTGTPPTAGGWGQDSYAGDITKGVVVWGAQAEFGTTPSPYVETTAPASGNVANVTAIDSTVAATPVWFSTILGDFTLTYTSGTVPSIVVNNNSTYIFSTLTQIAISPDASLYQPAKVTASELGTTSVLVDPIGNQLVQLQFKANSGNMGAFWCSI